MTEAYVEFPRIKWEKQRTLGLDKSFRDAVRDYCKRRWPYHTAKNAAREFKLTVDQGRSVANGTASMTTVEQCIKGRPEVGIPVLEEVMGVQLAPVFRQLFTITPDEVSRAVEHGPKAEAAWRKLATDRDLAGEDRRSWKAAGGVGASEAGPMANRRR
jgi:hypothetical protein